MPTDKDFKRLVRGRMAKTGEAYTTARAHLRPDDPDDPDDGDPGRLRGRHPDTAALARLLAALGVTDPSSGRPLTEAMALGVAGGIGFAYFVFEYEELTTLYLGGRLNSFVQKQDATEAALARLGVPAQIRRTSGPATAERHLRAALDQGRPVIATVDGARLRQGAVPDWLYGMLPQDVLVGLRDGEPVLWDLDPAPVPVTWAALAEARAGQVGPAADRAPRPQGLAAAAGRARPPVPAPHLAVRLGRDRRRRRRLLPADARRVPGGGGRSPRPARAGPAGRRLRKLAAAWTALAEAAVAVHPEDSADPRPLDATALPALLADLHRRVLDLAEAEEASATALREELE